MCLVTVIFPKCLWCTNNAGQLLSRFAEKKLHYKIVANSIKNSIIWRTKRLSLDSQETAQSQDTEVLGSQQVSFQ